MIPPLATLAICRFAQDTALLLLWGSCGYLAWLVPVGLAAELAVGLRTWDAVAVGTATLATVAELPVEAASIGDGWRDALDPAVVAAVLTDTGGGRAWAVQAVAIVLLLILRLIPARSRLVGTTAAAGLALGSLSLTGHAVIHEGWLGAANRTNDVLHVLSSGAWLGALVPVLAILPRLGKAEDRAQAVIALRRFSRVGHAAVALSILTGAASTALVLGRWPVNLSSPYEALLDAKALAVAAMARLAILNRYVLVPRLSPALPALCRATLAEVPLGLLAVGLVAVFGLLDPG